MPIFLRSIFTSRFLTQRHVFLNIKALMSTSVTSAWGYTGDTGPSHWGKDYAVCNGNNQSPIAIDTSHTQYKPTITDMDFSAYNTTVAEDSMFSNNGRTVRLDVHTPCHISGGDMDGQFNLEQFHFHWGRGDDAGAEHVVDGVMYPMELHLVHYAEKYRSISIAQEHDNGLVVLGVFLKAVEKDNPGLETLVTSLKHISFRAQSVCIPNLPLRPLLPNDLTTFYSYPGSFTTPPCCETVKWILFHEPITISHRQLSEFRKLRTTRCPQDENENQPSPEDIAKEDSGQYLLVDNYRPIQKLNGRTVHSSFENLRQV